jgi:hypothetical protein
MTYTFNHRDEKGFALEMEDQDGDTVYVGQAYGDTQTFSANTVEDVKAEFQRLVDERLGAEEDFDHDD